MSCEGQSRFDLGALQDLAGEKVFQRGSAYQRDGLVTILGRGSGRVIARVAGTRDYHTELVGGGTDIDGSCSCPAFEDWGFCKHMVAVGLAANAADGETEAEAVDSLARIREYLKEQDVDALVAMIMDLAERDPDICRRLELAAASVHADDKTLEAQMLRAIDDATRTGGYVDYREAAEWSAAVDSALDAVADLLSGKRAGLATALAAHAIRRIDEALDDVNESNDHCGALIYRARDIHLAACRATGPDPVELACDLFEREMRDPWGAFQGAASRYADVLGDLGLAEYRRLATRAWEQLPPRIDRSREPAGSSRDYSPLAEVLDFFAERDGDVETRIAIRTKDLSSTWRYLQLARFCLAQGRPEEALHRAEEGLWLFEDKCPDKELVLFAVELLLKAGRVDDAQAQLWRAFEKAPSLELYRRLRALGEETACQRAVALLEKRLCTDKAAIREFPADLLVSVLVEEKMFDRAWTAQREHGASPPVMLALAKACEKSRPQYSLAAYGQRVDVLVNEGGYSNYNAAYDLVVRMRALHSDDEHAVFVAGLKERFRRKRNFMKLLK